MTLPHDRSGIARRPARLPASTRLHADDFLKTGPGRQRLPQAPRPLRLPLSAAASPSCSPGTRSSSLIARSAALALRTFTKGRASAIHLLLWDAQFAGPGVISPRIRIRPSGRKRE